MDCISGQDVVVDLLHLNKHYFQPNSAGLRKAHPTLTGQFCCFVSNSVKMNLLVCGDFEAFALEVDPGETTASTLKQRISKALDIPVSELTLYFNNSQMPDDTPLSQWKNMRSGAAVLVAANPLKVTLQRYNSDIDVKFEIPRSCVQQWTVETLLEYGLYKSGLLTRIDGKYIFMTKGKIIKEENKRAIVSKCDWLVSNDCIMLSVSFVAKMHCTDNLVQGGRKEREFYVPECTSTSIIEKILTSQQKINTRNKPSFESHITYNEFPKWKITIQKLNGEKVTVELNDHCFTSIHKLKLILSLLEKQKQTHCDHIEDERLEYYVQNELKKIRLTFGTTVLEDWDDEGNMMLLCSYPDLHDGATLCQINLTGAIIVNIPSSSRALYLSSGISSVSKYNIPSKLEQRSLHLEIKSCILIEDPRHFSVNRLIKIVQNCGVSGSLCNMEPARNHEDRYRHGSGWGHQRQQDTQQWLNPSDNPVSSVDFIYDGCTLSIAHRSRTSRNKTIIFE